MSALLLVLSLTPLLQKCATIMTESLMVNEEKDLCSNRTNSHVVANNFAWSRSRQGSDKNAMRQRQACDERATRQRRGYRQKNEP
jgi:hypothetical protein